MGIHGDSWWLMVIHGDSTNQDISHKSISDFFFIHSLCWKTMKASTRDRVSGCLGCLRLYPKSRTSHPTFKTFNWWVLNVVMRNVVGYWVTDFRQYQSSQWWTKQKYSITARFYGFTWLQLQNKRSQRLGGWGPSFKMINLWALLPQYHFFLMARSWFIVDGIKKAGCFKLNIWDHLISPSEVEISWYLPSFW